MFFSPVTYCYNFTYECCFFRYIRRYYDDFLRILVSFYERRASPAHILLKIAALRSTNGLKRAALELGKVCRSLFLLRIGMDIALSGEIQNECLKGERWHEFGKEIFIGHGGKLQEDSLEEQYRTLLMLNVVLNCIALWNTLAIQSVVGKLRASGDSISENQLGHLTPTMTHHIDLIGKFEIDLFRRVPFKFSPRKVGDQQELSKYWMQLLSENSKLKTRKNGIGKVDQTFVITGLKPKSEISHVPFFGV